jgi:hypothetical protein
MSGSAEQLADDYAREARLMMCQNVAKATD